MSRIECPSGLVFEGRALKMKEADILADAQAARKGASLDNMLASVTSDILDPGPYELKDGKLNWGDALSGDRLYAQMAVRVLSFGPEYEFTVVCPVCKESQPWGVNLDDVPVQKLDPADVATFKAGNIFKWKSDTGITYTFRLMTGKIERLAREKLKNNPQARVTASLGARITEIVDADGNEVKNRQAFLEDLSMVESRDLVSGLDSHDCGLETGIDIECQSCGAVSEVELPFDQRGYWAPKAKKTQKTT